MSEEKLPTEVINAKDANTKKPIPLEVIIKNEDGSSTSRRQSWDIHWEEYQPPHRGSLNHLQSRADFEKQLKSLAADGWELVGVVGAEMFFKRLK
ncbi:MAG: hypothetical protein QOF02_2598 [Blastocatellia bacterium]|jgi:hypothetical protein|nr:hypothetical protein [Blastocatellia bacterium]